MVVSFLQTINVPNSTSAMVWILIGILGASDRQILPVTFQRERRIARYYLSFSQTKPVSQIRGGNATVHRNSEYRKNHLFNLRCTQPLWNPRMP
ncbi:hypothetical protein N7465_003826 [Penicillium sp. CMV-2018d]|nr:hypothetical protein N7465_003826 [Penicillium sp. CMV-2018d]